MNATRSASTVSAVPHHEVPESATTDGKNSRKPLKLGYWGGRCEGSIVSSLEGLDSMITCEIEGAEFPDALRGHQVDAILLEWDEFSTIEKCLRRIRSVEAFTGMPILAMFPETTPSDSLAVGIDGEVEFLFPGASLAELRFRVERSARFLSTKKKHDSLEVYKRKLVEAIAHDVRSPLHTVSFALDLIQESLEKENSRFVKMILGAKESTSKITEIMDMMLKIHQLEESDGSLSLSEVDAQSAVDEAIALNEDSISIRNEVEPQTMVMADRSLLVRSFAKLIRNSLRYLPVEDGRIVIHSEKTGKAMKILIEENAKALPAEFLGEVFEMFARVPEPDGKLGRSFGLDFAFCRASIQGQGGRLVAEPSGRGGNIFAATLQLPPE